MKKFILATIVLMLSSTYIFAQEEEDDSLDIVVDTVILPESGDWGLGVDMTPFFRYVGTFIGGGTNISPSFNFTTQQPLTITGKYFLDDVSAVRVAFRIGSNHITDNQYVIDDADSTLETSVLDSKENKTKHIALGIGYEKRKGSNRLQAVYGGMFMMSYSSDNSDYLYGNAMAVNNPAPTTYSWTINDTLSSSSRILTDYNGTSLGLKIYGFVGVEYFILHKMSIGGEISYGINYFHLNEGSRSYETWDNLNKKVTTTTEKTHSKNNFSLDTGISGALNLTFYF